MDLRSLMVSRSFFFSYSALSRSARVVFRSLRSLWASFLVDLYFFPMVGEAALKGVYVVFCDGKGFPQFLVCELPTT